MIGVVVPTVPGRAEHVERCVGAYVRATAAKVWVILEWDRPTCGIAWQRGAQRARAAGCEYLHLTADDLVPHEGWDIPARETADHGGIPAPVVHRPQGGIESSGGWWDRAHADWEQTSNTSVVPFCTLEAWATIGPMLPLHYYTDNWFTYRAREAGMPVVVRNGYAFTHHWAQARRHGDDRMQADRLAFEAACSS